jgi:hypothetical protein
MPRSATRISSRELRDIGALIHWPLVEAHLLILKCSYEYPDIMLLSSVARRGPFDGHRSQSIHLMRPEDISGAGAKRGA